MKHFRFFVLALLVVILCGPLVSAAFLPGEESFGGGSDFGGALSSVGDVDEYIGGVGEISDMVGDLDLLGVGLFGAGFIAKEAFFDEEKKATDAGTQATSTEVVVTQTRVQYNRTPDSSDLFQRIADRLRERGGQAQTSSSQTQTGQGAPVPSVFSPTIYTPSSPAYVPPAMTLPSLPTTSVTPSTPTQPTQETPKGGSDAQATTPVSPNTQSQPEVPSRGKDTPHTSPVIDDTVVRIAYGTAENAGELIIPKRLLSAEKPEPQTTNTQTEKKEEGLLSKIAVFFGEKIDQFIRKESESSDETAVNGALTQTGVVPQSAPGTFSTLSIPQEGSARPSVRLSTRTTSSFPEGSVDGEAQVYLGDIIEASEAEIVELQARAGTSGASAETPKQTPGIVPGFVLRTECTTILKLLEELANHAKGVRVLDPETKKFKEDMLRRLLEAAERNGFKENPECTAQVQDKINELPDQARADLFGQAPPLPKLIQNAPKTIQNTPGATTKSWWQRMIEGAGKRIDESVGKILSGTVSLPSLGGITEGLAVSEEQCKETLPEFLQLNEKNAGKATPASLENNAEKSETYASYIPTIQTAAKRNPKEQQYIYVEKGGSGKWYKNLLEGKETEVPVDVGTLRAIMQTRPTRVVHVHTHPAMAGQNTPPSISDAELWHDFNIRKLTIGATVRLEMQVVDPAGSIWNYETVADFAASRAREVASSDKYLFHFLNEPQVKAFREKNGLTDFTPWNSEMKIWKAANDEALSGRLGAANKKTAEEALQDPWMQAKMFRLKLPNLTAADVQDAIAKYRAVGIIVTKVDPNQTQTAPRFEDPRAEAPGGMQPVAFVTCLGKEVKDALDEKLHPESEIDTTAASPTLILVKEIDEDVSGVAASAEEAGTSQSPIAQAWNAAIGKIEDLVEVASSAVTETFSKESGEHYEMQTLSNKTTPSLFKEGSFEDARPLICTDAQLNESEVEYICVERGAKKECYMGHAGRVGSGGVHVSMDFLIELLQSTPAPDRIVHIHTHPASLLPGASKLSPASLQDAKIAAELKRFDPKGILEMYAVDGTCAAWMYRVSPTYAEKEAELSKAMTDFFKIPEVMRRLAIGGSKLSEIIADAIEGKLGEDARKAALEVDKKIKEIDAASSHEGKEIAERQLQDILKRLAAIGFIVTRK